ncbi:hypothetical protein [Streptomyces chartreusis]|uniref:hypothetical protein n=1 Tax=Streptomyces chartreusis TaxID=1969 RepID=UPI00362E08BB
MPTVTFDDRHRLDLGGQQPLLRSATGKAVADKAEPVMHRKWLGRLGAVDVFTRENALTVALSHIVDAPRDL